MINNLRYDRILEASGMKKINTDTTLVKDIALRFPNAVLLKASAG
jgi:hypothetical protein